MKLTLSAASAQHGLLDSLMHDEHLILQDIREGRFQRALALVAALSAVLSGGEVAYEHYRGSYSQQIMYTPLLLSAALFLSGISATVSRRVARSLLPLFSILVILDGLAGFVFHVRGIARKPGGWRVPITNLILGPPVLAPLLFGLSGYLGLVASFLRRPDDPPTTNDRGNVPSDRFPSLGLRTRGGLKSIIPSIRKEGIEFERHVREGRFQQNIAAVAGLSAICSGFEASYSHYENNFRYPFLQWSPMVVAPALGVAGIGAVWSPRAARTVLPVMSVLAITDGMIGTFFHIRGILQKPGGMKLPLYNLMYGPPIFAPMLFAASGFMGILAALLRREPRG